MYIPTAIICIIQECTTKILTTTIYTSLECSTSCVKYTFVSYFLMRHTSTCILWLQDATHLCLFRPALLTALWSQSHAMLHSLAVAWISTLHRCCDEVTYLIVCKLQGERGLVHSHPLPWKSSSSIPCASEHDSTILPHARCIVVSFLLPPPHVSHFHEVWSVKVDVGDSVAVVGFHSASKAVLSVVLLTQPNLQCNIDCFLPKPYVRMSWNRNVSILVVVATPHTSHRHVYTTILPIKL